MNIYLGNLSSDVYENDVRKLIEPYGEVALISVHEDKYSGRPRRFAFVKMLQDKAAHAVINALNGMDLKGLAMSVMKADSSGEDMSTML
jgi:polyadenylate-binding protein